MDYYSSLIISVAVISTSLTISQGVHSNLDQIIETNIIEQQQLAFRNNIINKHHRALENYIDNSQGKIDFHSETSNDTVFHINNTITYCDAIHIGDLDGNIMANSIGSKSSPNRYVANDQNGYNKLHFQENFQANDVAILQEKI